jgi:hypothetical protein
VKQNDRLSLIAIGTSFLALFISLAKGKHASLPAQAQAGVEAENRADVGISATMKSSKSLFGIPLWESPEMMRKTDTKRVKAHLDFVKNILFGAGFAITVAIFFATSKDAVNPALGFALLVFGIAIAVFFCAWAANAYVLELQLFNPYIRLILTFFALSCVLFVLYIDFTVFVTHMWAQQTSHQAESLHLQRICGPRPVARVAEVTEGTSRPSKPAPLKAK